MNAAVKEALPEVSYSLVPAKVNTNVEAVRRALEVELEKYDVVVTADTLTDARKLAADVNKLKSAINSRRKALLEELSAPANAVDTQLRDLMKRCDEGRARLTSQIALFDKQQAERAHEKAREELSKLYREHGTTADFCTGNPSTWAKASALTKTGKLTAAVRKEIEAVVKADTERQDQYHARIADLARMSELYKISTPLTKSDVEHILKIESAVEYNERVHEILKRTAAREKAAAEAADAKLREEMTKSEQAPADDRVHDQQAEAVRAIEDAVSSQEAKESEQQDRLEALKREFDAHEVEEPTDRGDGRVPVQVTCTFDTRVTPGISAEAIERELRKVMGRAGISTLSSVTVRM